MWESGYDCSMWKEEVQGIEFHLISPTKDFYPSDDWTPRLKSLVAAACSGKFVESLSLCGKGLSILNYKTFEDVLLLKSKISEYFNECKDQKERTEREIELLLYGSSCLQLFVINNWTGPPTLDIQSLFPGLDLCGVKDEILQSLEVDGEQVYSILRHPILLCIAISVFQQPDLFQHCSTVTWWCLRYISIHQQLLSERAPTLYEKSASMVEMLSNLSFLDSNANRSLKIQLHLEIGLLQLHYYQYKDAETNFETATRISGLNYNLGGALGVRTRFQQNVIAQLRFQVSREAQEPIISKTPPLSAEDIPKALPLNDDTLLESVKFSENSDEDDNVVLTAEDHAIVLMMCTNMQKTSPSHRLRDEQITCVIEYLLSEPKSWSVHAEALRMRCNLEKHRSRTVERSLMQLEFLAKNISPKSSQMPSDPATAALKRLSLFYCVWPKPSWTIEKQLAGLFESLGVLSSALEIYERLHMWEEAIICLIRTDRGHQAQQLIEEQLAIKETPNLLCLLGDVRQDPELYLKAWEVSKHRSARAMRSLGAYNISKKLYQEAVECFEKSLSANYLQVGTWFSMGCAALANEDFEKAAKAFQKCVSLNWDNFEAWTNLSTAFVRCNKKIQAFKALKEGLKCNFNRWELWENFLFVSTDTGHFQEVIQAYNRLLDLKDKYVEVSVLEILVRAITENMEDAKEVPASRYKSKVLELFGRLTSKVTSNWEVWSLYAKLFGNGTNSDNTNENDKALSFLQKALRSALQRPSWEKELKHATQNAKLGIKLIDACLHCHKQKRMTDEQLQPLLASTKMSVNGLKAKLKMQEKSLLKDDVKKDYQDIASQVDEKLLELGQLLTNI